MSSMTLAAPRKLLDIVYPVRPDDDRPNDELRWSLRSVEANYPHGRVWIVGHKPDWLTWVHHIPGNTQRFRHANVFHNILAACRHPNTPDEFVVFNDDFFVTRPVSEAPVWYRRTLKEHLRIPKLRQNPGGWWATSLRTTLTCLRDLGYEDPLSYELHTPFVVNKHLMADTLERFVDVAPENPPQWRSLYGNLNHIGGIQAGDCKMSRPGPIKYPFHSTDDSSWRMYFGVRIKAMFPNPSRYEAPCPLS